MKTVKDYPGRITSKINDGNFGYRVYVIYDQKFPKQAEQVAKIYNVHRYGHTSYRSSVKIGVYENRLYIEQNANRRRKCIAVDDFQRYMATEIALRLHLGVGMYKDSIRLAVDLIYQLYNNNDMPIVCIPFLRRIKPN